MKKNLKYLMKKKDRNEKITMLACHDFPTARWAEEADLDIVLVGDSLGVNILGYESAEQVTMDDMLHHFKAVQRAVKNAYLIADLPLSSSKNLSQALEDSQRLMDHGADAVKLETFSQKLVEYLLENYIEVCLDVIYPLAKMKYSKSEEDDLDIMAGLIKMAVELQKKSLGIILLTMFPKEAAKAATELLTVPVIGVGSGPFTNGQVLVASEILGLKKTGPTDLYSKQFVDFEALGCSALNDFVEEIRNERFPTEKNCETLSQEQYKRFIELLEADEE